MGANGNVVGIELSPHMSALARRRAADIDSRCIRVVEGRANELAHLFACVKPGARVAVAGTKQGSAWALPLSLITLFRARNYLTTYEGMQAPWSHLPRWVPDFQWQTRQAGTSYVGWGHVSVIAASNSWGNQWFD